MVATKRHKNSFVFGVNSAQEKKGATNGGNTIVKTPIGKLFQKWTQRYSTGRILWGAGFVLAILSLVAVVAISCRSGKQLQEATRAVTHTAKSWKNWGHRGPIK